MDRPVPEKETAVKGKVVNKSDIAQNTFPRLVLLRS